MKGIRTLLIPITAAWIVAGLWWVSRQNACGCIPTSGSTSGTASASIIHLGPEAAATLAPPASAPVPTEATTEAAPVAATGDAAFLPALVIPVVKNEQGSGLSEDAQQWCEAARVHLLAHPEASITVTGHTDADGDADLNRNLSLRRAESVKTQLVARGLPAERITAVGMGADEPISDNRTSKGKAMNRRVEIHVEGR